MKKSCVKTGWLLEIYGAVFRPENLFKESRLQPSETGLDYAIFSELHPGPYPLDIATEAFDYLSNNVAELEQLVASPGIEQRTLRFFDSLQGHGGSFSFDLDQLSLLVRLKIRLDIIVVEQ